MNYLIDIAEEFPNLPKAPIVEAVIHWRARSSAEWFQEKLVEEVRKSFPGFPEIESLNQLLVGLEARVGSHSEAPTTTRQDSWYGFKLFSNDRKNIIQFNRDGIAFSRLAPYQDWDRFSSEAIDAWQIFAKLATPLEIARLGVRFINRIPSATAGTLHNYLNDPPSRPVELPLESFLYKSTFQVPGSSLSVNVVKTLQSAPTPQPQGLIVDIDVFSTSQFACDDPMMSRRLLEMRWLKNKVFFALMTSDAINSFKRP